MSLKPGARLGPHEITAPLGAGGMGEVYRATDTNLNRSVAIKVLPASVAGDADRLARFQREAELLAALNHPNIAAVYGLERTDGTTALVMELVEGPTLADRIAKGPLPVDEALAIAKQIAEALEAAHEQGIIHRDLKPANVKVRDDGTVKVLDFGLAKALEPASAASSPESTHSPTLTSPALSQTGVILGTAAYMSPEQARGKAVDRRADVWAFGAVLFEMLTGQRAFAGEDMTDTLAAVVRSEPGWEALPGALPPTLRAYLRRCLEKNPKERLHDIADVRLALAGAFEEPSGQPDQPSSFLKARLIPAAVVAASFLAGILVGHAWLGGVVVVPDKVLSRFIVDVPSGQHLSGGLEMEQRPWALQRPSRRSLALSPDGRDLVFVASDGTTSRLFRRPMGQTVATPMPGTEGASSPVFSPDGRAVAFRVGFGGTPELKRVSMETGEVRPLTLSGLEGDVFGFSWSSRETLLLGSGGGVYEVPATGGNVSRLTSDDSPQDGFVVDPLLLPGHQAVLFGVRSSSVPSEWNIFVESLATGRRHAVVEGGSDPRYVATGHILFARRGTLMAVPFDAERLEATGPPLAVLEDVMQAERGGNTGLNTGEGQFAVSRSGTLVYATGGVYPIVPNFAVWVDRTGASEPVSLPPGRYQHVRFAPDGSRLAYDAGVAGDRQIWVYDIDLETPVRLTTSGSNGHPTWSPDGTRLAFDSEVNGRHQLFWMPSDGRAQPVRFAATDAEIQMPASWSSDGTLAFLNVQREPLNSDIWTVSPEGQDAPKPFVETLDPEAYPAFSPDGRWLAYASLEAGRLEVYVRPFPDGAPAYRVSTEGGDAPAWSPDGKQLFYQALTSGETTTFMVVDVDTDGAFDRGQPRKLFDMPDYAGTVPLRSYDVAPDGKRFVMFRLAASEPQPVTRIHVVLNWFEELNELVPVD